MSRWKLITILVVVALVVIIVLQNTKPVETKLLFATVEIPRIVLLVVMFLIGFGTGFFTLSHMTRKRQKPEQMEP